MKKAISIILSLSMMLSLAACGSKTETVSNGTGGSSGSSETAQEAGSSGTSESTEVGGNVVINESGSVGDGSMAGREDLTFAMASETGSLDPGAYNNNWSFGVTMQIYESLLREAPGDRQEIEPVLCENYEFLDDGLTLRFHLKDGIKFHDGSIMTADDVEYSLNKAIGMPANSALSSMMIDAVKVDDSTVDLHLEYSFEPILNIIAFPTFGIVNKNWYENAEAEGRNINTEANGTGPYKFVSWTRGDSIVLEAFEDWHGGEVSIKDLTYKFLTDSTSASIALENGDVQALLGVSSADLKRLREIPEIFCATTYSSGMYYVGLNCEEGPFADIKVRQAMQYALNADEVLVGGMDGQGWTVTCAAPRGVFGYQEDFVPSRNNIEKAKELLEEAGYSDGVKASIKCAAFDEYLMSTQIIQEQARQAGIELEFEQMEETSLITDVFENHDFDSFYYWAGCAYPDIDSLYWRLYHSDSISKDNTAGVTELDDKLYQARTSHDDEERYELYREITAANDENVWYIPLIMSTYTVCVRSSLSNVYANNAGLYHISDWTY